MAKEDKALTVNTIETREQWLKSATNSLRPMFEKAGLPLPASIRYAIAFTSSGRKGKAVGETWHAPASADGHYEIMIRADIADPVEVLVVLTRQLVHAALPPKEDSGRLFKAAASKIGLQGKMRDCSPNPLLADRLNALAAELPPLPHARLDIHWKAIDRPKKQGTRMRKAECMGVLGDQDSIREPCGYTIRLASKWARLGAKCPIHGDMQIAEEDDDEPRQGADELQPTPTEHHA